jgi:hypothetical protein
MAPSQPSRNRIEGGNYAAHCYAKVRSFSSGLHEYSRRLMTNFHTPVQTVAAGRLEWPLIDFSFDFDFKFVIVVFQTTVNFVCLSVAISSIPIEPYLIIRQNGSVYSNLSLDSLLLIELAVYATLHRRSCKCTALG